MIENLVCMFENTKKQNDWPSAFEFKVDLFLRIGDGLAGLSH